MNYIDENVKIDFKVPADIRGLMDKCEEYDKMDDYGAYENYCNVLVFVVSKEAYVQGDITKGQWETIERRYRL